MGPQNRGDSGQGCYNEAWCLYTEKQCVNHAYSGTPLINQDTSGTWEGGGVQKGVLIPYLRG